MRKNLNKIIIIILSFIALSFIIYNIKGYNFYFKFTNFTERFNRKGIYTDYQNNGKKKTNVEKNKGGKSKLINNNEFSKFDINSADMHKLIMLPGIGFKTAQKIINYREINGPFQSFNDLTKVNGIGPKKVENLKKFIIFK